MSKKLTVVGAVWCTACTALKKQLDVKGIMYDYIDADSDEGGIFCQYHKIRGLPTSLIIFDNDIVKVVVGNKVNEIEEGLK